jgi:hypothetical protein
MHDAVDQVSLEMARRVAARLRADPSLLQFARKTLDGWKEQHRESPSLLRCDIEWERILNRSIEEICEILCADNDEGQRLRQNAPFSGILPRAEVDQIKKEFRRREAART